MNSKQRRKFRRKWKYVAEVTEVREWASHLVRLCDMDEWCINRFGKHKYVVDGYGLKFYFDSMENFIEFKITWSQ